MGSEINEDRSNRSDVKPGIATEFPSIVPRLVQVTALILTIALWIGLLTLRQSILALPEIVLSTALTVESYILFIFATTIAAGISVLWYYFTAPSLIKSELKPVYRQISQSTVVTFFVLVGINAIVIAIILVNSSSFNTGIPVNAVSLPVPIIIILLLLICLGMFAVNPTVAIRGLVLVSGFLLLSLIQGGRISRYLPSTETETLVQGTLLTGYFVMISLSLVLPNTITRFNLSDSFDELGDLNHRYDELCERVELARQKTPETMDVTIDEGFSHPVNYPSATAAKEALDDFEDEIEVIETQASLIDRIKTVRNKYEKLEKSIAKRDLDITLETNDLDVNPNDIPDEPSELDKLDKEIETSCHIIEDWEEILSRYDTCIEKKENLQRQLNSLDRSDTFPIPDILEGRPIQTSFQQLSSREEIKQSCSEIETQIEDWGDIITRHKQITDKKQKLREINVTKGGDPIFDPDVLNEDLIQSGHQRHSSLDEVRRNYDETEKRIHEWFDLIAKYTETADTHSVLKETVRSTDLDPSFGSCHLELDNANDLEEVREALESWESKVNFRCDLAKKYRDLSQRKTKLQQRCAKLELPDGVVDVELPDLTHPITLRTDKEQLNQCQDELDRIEQLVSTASNLVSLRSKSDKYVDSYPEYQFSSFINWLDSLLLETADYKSKVNKYEQEYEAACEVINLSSEIVQFLEVVDESHPSVDHGEWKSAVDTALNNNSPNIIRPIASDIKSMKNGMWEHSDLSVYDWQEFESLIGALYDDKGYDTEVTQQSGDAGIDVWARNTEQTVAIQVKKYQNNNNVGRPALQKTASTIAKGDADRAVVITSSGFTDAATMYAEEFGGNLELVDGTDLIKNLSKSSLPPPSS